MAVLSLPFLPFCRLSEETVGGAQVACADRVRKAQSILGCLMPDHRYARSRFLYFDGTKLAWPVLL